MIVCPRCGSSVGPAAAHCSVCGAALETSPKTEPSAPKQEPMRPKLDSASSMKRTMVGMAPEMSAPAPQASGPNKLKGTMIGMPVANPGGVPPAPASPAGTGAPPVAAGAPPSAPFAGGATSLGSGFGGSFGGTTGAGGAPARPGGAAGKQTMIGVASPMAAAPQSSPMPPVPPAQPGGMPPERPVGDHKRTMMGVAMPGIAPLAPGVPKEPPAPVDPAAPPAGVAPPGFGAPVGYAPPAGHAPPAGYAPPAGHAPPGGGYNPGYYQAASDVPRPRSARPPAKPRSQYSAAIAIGGGLVLATIAAIFAFFWRGPAPLRAEARVDSTGTDLLHITCSTCPDGTVLRIGEATANVAAQVADVTLPAPLAVGENLFTVGVDRPANGRDENVSLVVRIGYRIRPDLSGLEAERPLLRILIEGAPLAKMIIDGKPLDLAADGKGHYDVDVSQECTGTADETKTIERSVSYSVIGASGKPEEGAVALRVAVTPLHFDVPSAQAVIEGDHFLLGGKTGRGARVVGGTESIATAADGSFSKSIAAPALGSNDVTVRTIVPGQAPRTATVHVKRVERLADEARTFAAGAPLAFTDLVSDVGKHVGERIVLAGDVVEARPQGARNIALIDVVKGCTRPPCAARVVFPATDPLARGDHLQVYGRVTRAISAKGEATGTVPEVESDFFLKRR